MNKNFSYVYDLLTWTTDNRVNVSQVPETQRWRLDATRLQWTAFPTAERMVHCDVSKTCQYVFSFLSLVLLSWLYVVRFSKNVPVSSHAEIQLNVIDRDSVVSRINLSEMGRRQSDSGVYKRKIRQHVPKFMLELYESGKNEGRNYTKADVVRSLIPKCAGRSLTHNLISSNNNYVLCKWNYFVYQIFHS